MFRRKRTPLPTGDLGPNDNAWSMVEGGTPAEPVFIRRNHAIAAAKGGAHEHMVLVKLALVDPDPRGMPVADDFSRLNRFEDALVESFGPESLAAAVITRGGHRDFLLYSSDEPATKAAVGGVAERLGEQERTGYGTSHDPHWRYYAQFMAMRP